MDRVVLVPRVLRCGRCDEVLDERHNRDGCKARLSRRFFFGILAGAATSGLLPVMAHEDVFDDPYLLRTGDKLICPEIPWLVEYKREERRRPGKPNTTRDGYIEYLPERCIHGPEPVYAAAVIGGACANIIEAFEPVRISRLGYVFEPGDRQPRVERRSRW